MSTPRNKVDETAALYEKLRAARAKAAFIRPYFSRALYALVLVVLDDRPDMQTMACDRYYRCYCARGFVTRSEIDELAAVFLHEIAHLLRRHHERADARGVTNADLIKNVAFLISSDCEINDDLARDLEATRDVGLPGKYWLPKHIGCPDDRAMEFYYEHLRQQMEDAVSKSSSVEEAIEAINGVLDRDGGGGDDDKQDGSGGKGKQGRGQGQPKNKGGDGGKDDVRRQMMGKVGGQCGSGAAGGRAPWDMDAPGGNGPDGIEDADSRDIERRVAKDIADHQKSRGNVPGEWVHWATDLLRPTPIPWDQVLSGALCRAIDEVAGMFLHSYRRPSRRQSAYEKVIMPSLRRPVPFVVFVGDTSGSMGDRDLALVRGVFEDCCTAAGARTAFLATDAAVHGDIQYATDGTGIELRGRGGTDMRVGILFALTEVMPRPDVVVVVTDGETPWPDEPTDTPILVCIVRPGVHAMAAVPPWMVAIEVTPEEEETP